MLKKEKINLLLSFMIILLTAAFTFKTVYDEIILLNNPSYSSPWYIPILVNLLIFVIPILGCIILLNFTKSKK